MCSKVHIVFVGMTQDKLWMSKYQEVVNFVETNKRNPSRYDDEEREVFELVEA